jgi:general secretion pathway protein F/type IV pilus assembly protein PilC
VPLASARLSVFYRQLSQQLGAGLTLVQALRAPSPAPADDTARMAARAAGGESVAAVVAGAGAWLPQADRPVLVAAAQAGRLPLVLSHLAERHAELAATRRRVIMACLYPVGVFHFGALLFPFLRLIDFERGLQWSLSAYLGGLLAILVPVWGGAVLLWYLVRRENAFALAFLNLLPAIGGYRKNQALADFSFALGNLLEAGAPISRAWRDAGEICGSPRLRAAAEVIHDRIQLGEAPGPLLAATKAFPHEFMVRYQTGESTGSLEQALLALAADHQTTANQRLVAASVLYPGMLFGLVAIMVGYVVITFFLSYIRTLESLM